MSGQSLSRTSSGLPPARSKFMAPIRIVGRELGVIELESERQYAFGR